MKTEVIHILRSILRNKVNSLINIFGIGLGFTCLIIVFLWVSYDLKYDSYHSNYNSIYRVIVDLDIDGNNQHSARTPAPLGPLLKESYPFINQFTRIIVFSGTSAGQIRYNDKSFLESRICIADPTYPKVFDLQVEEGNPNFLQNPNSIGISRSTANKYFGTENPIGKMLSIDDEINLEVGAVFKDIPEQSHIYFDFIISILYFKELGSNFDSWQVRSPLYTYVLVNNENVDDLYNMVDQTFIKQHSEGNIQELTFQPLKEIYLKSNFTGDISSLGSIDRVYFILFLGVVILALACINFVNLATAQYVRTANEVGIKRICGATSGKIFIRFLFESAIYTLFAFVLSLLIVELLNPIVSSFSDVSLKIDYSNSTFIVFSITMLAITTLIAGIYPALYALRFKPNHALKKRFTPGKYQNRLRWLLTLVQLCVTVVTVIVTLTISKQMTFASTKDLGYQHNDKVYFRLSSKLSEELDYLKSSLTHVNGVRGVSTASHLVTEVVHDNWPISWDGKSTDLETFLNVLFVDEDFVKILGLKTIKGVAIDSTKKGMYNEFFMLNEEAYKLMGSPDLPYRIKVGNFEGMAIGVVSNFHFKPLHNSIEPLILMYSHLEMFYLYISLENHLNTGVLNEVIDRLERIDPNYLPDYGKLSDALSIMYEKDRQYARFSTTIATLSIMLSCLGLFGLSVFNANQRRKEMAVRKVLGASVKEILFLLGGGYLQWVFLASVVGIPLGLFISNRWLDRFAYSTEVGLLIPVLATLVTLLITFVTVSFKAWDCGNTNPSESLMWE